MSCCPDCETGDKQERNQYESWASHLTNAELATVLQHMRTVPDTAGADAALNEASLRLERGQGVPEGDKINMGIKTTGNSQIDTATAEIAGHVRDGRVGSHVRYRDQNHYDEAMRLRDEILKGADERRQQGVGPGGPSRASELAVNPDNQEAKTARRTKLLEAFDRLDASTRADLLERAESWAFRATAPVNTGSYYARDIFRRMYATAGWEE